MLFVEVSAPVIVTYDRVEANIVAFSLHALGRRSRDVTSTFVQKGPAVLADLKLQSLPQNNQYTCSDGSELWQVVQAHASVVSSMYCTAHAGRASRLGSISRQISVSSTADGPARQCLGFDILALNGHLPLHVKT